MSGPAGPAGGTPEYATSAAVAGLAREVEALRRTVDTTAGVTRRVEDLAAVVADLAVAVEQLTATPTVAPPACWLDLAADEAETFALLSKLTLWLGGIYLAYGDAVLPDCWAWHPDLIEELLWLSQAWQTAYAGPRASVVLVGDWHDRQRPNVARRIKQTAGACSIEDHQTPASRPGVPLVDAVEAIAAWWAHHRTQPPPAPTPDQLAAAAARPTKGRR